MASTSEYFNPINFERSLAVINGVGERERVRVRERGKRRGREGRRGSERKKERLLYVEFI